MKHTYITINLGSNYVHIGMDLATKSIPIQLPESFDINAYVRFPRIQILTKEKGSALSAKLCNPIPCKECGEELPSESWGQISYIVRHNVHIPILSVCGFVIDVESENCINEDDIDKIKEYITVCTENILSVLCIKYPEFITDKTLVRKYHFVATCSANYVQGKGNRMIEIPGTCFAMLPGKTISSSILFPLIRQCNNQLTIQYQLLIEMKYYLRRGDYRSCVLHASTIFETTLLQKLKKYLVDNKVPDKISKIIDKKIHGFSSYEDFYGTDFPKCVDAKVKQTVTLRNKVIHNGKQVTKQDAQDAYDASLTFLQFYDWPYFVVLKE